MVCHFFAPAFELRFPFISNAPCCRHSIFRRTLQEDIGSKERRARGRNVVVANVLATLKLIVDRANHDGDKLDAASRRQSAPLSSRQRQSRPPPRQREPQRVAAPFPSLTSYSVLP